MRHDMCLRGYIARPPLRLRARCCDAVITIKHPVPFFDDSYAVDSANVGPYGSAIMTELLPAVEAAYRGIGEGWARGVLGGSTGGWEALAVQVLYPDEFNYAVAAVSYPTHHPTQPRRSLCAASAHVTCHACANLAATRFPRAVSRGWVSTHERTCCQCPDPVGFNSYTTVNLYADSNAYYYDAQFKRTPRPGYRDHCLDAGLERGDRTCGASCHVVCLLPCLIPPLPPPVQTQGRQSSRAAQPLPMATRMGRQRQQSRR